MDKTPDRNFVIRFCPKHLAIDQKSSKTVIALGGKPISDLQVVGESAISLALAKRYGILCFYTDTHILSMIKVNSRRY